jgi:hypothetical protein
MVNLKLSYSNLKVKIKLKGCSPPSPLDPPLVVVLASTVVLSTILRMSSSPNGETARCSYDSSIITASPAWGSQTTTHSRSNINATVRWVERTVEL